MNSQRIYRVGYDYQLRYHHFIYSDGTLAYKGSNSKHSGINIVPIGVHIENWLDYEWNV